MDKIKKKVSKRFWIVEEDCLLYIETINKYDYMKYAFSSTVCIDMNGGLPDPPLEWKTGDINIFYTYIIGLNQSIGGGVMNYRNKIC